MFCDVIFKSSKVPVGNDSPDTRNKVFFKCKYLKPILFKGDFFELHSLKFSYLEVVTYFCCVQKIRKDFVSFHLHWGLIRVCPPTSNIKGAQVWDFRSLRFWWFLYHKVSMGGEGTLGLKYKFVFWYLGVHLLKVTQAWDNFEFFFT
jgi:hypothetical protein